MIIFNQYQPYRSFCFSGQTPWIPYGYSNPDDLDPILEQYSLENNTFAMLAIQNYIAGIDCRDKDNDYLPYFLVYITSILSLLMIFLVHIRKNNLKKKKQIYVSIASKKLVSIELLTMLQVSVYLLAENYSINPTVLAVFQFMEGFISSGVFWFTDVFFFQAGMGFHLYMRQSKI